MALLRILLCLTIIIGLTSIVNCANRDAGFSQWSFFGMCSAYCDGGTQKRTRQCLDVNKGCDGPIEDTRVCNDHFCPIDGKFSEWGPYSICSQTCGGGTQSRSRTCSKPGPFGTPCQGPLSETRKCNQAACPVKSFTMTEYVCEHTRGRSVYCPNGMTMRVLSGFYGRTSMQPCSKYNGVHRTNCLAGGSFSKISAACNGKRGCYLSPGNHVFGDPCPGVGKYIEIRYRCQ